MHFKHICLAARNIKKKTEQNFQWEMVSHCGSQTWACTCRPLELLTQWAWDELQTSSQATMMLLIWGSHLQKHQALRIPRTAKFFLVYEERKQIVKIGTYKNQTVFKT